MADAPPGDQLHAEQRRHLHALSLRTLRPPSPAAGSARPFVPLPAQLTGTADQLASAAKSFGVVFFKVAGSAPGEYTFAHSAIVTLLGPKGGLVTRFSTDSGADRIAWTVRTLIDGGAS